MGVLADSSYQPAAPGMRGAPSTTAPAAAWNALRWQAWRLGARTYAVPTVLDQLRLEIEAEGWHPTLVEVRALRGVDFGAPWLPLGASGLSEGWRLLAPARLPVPHEPPPDSRTPVGPPDLSALGPLTRRALDHVSVDRLALAVRSWDPEPVSPATEEREHAERRRRARVAVRRAERALAAFKAMELAPEQTVFTRDGRCHLDTRVADMLRFLESKVQQYRDHLDWTRWSHDQDLRLAQATSAAEKAGYAGKLPPFWEAAITTQVRRYWTPVAADLRRDTSGGRFVRGGRQTWWTFERLADLVLEDSWFADLVPYTRGRECARREDGSLALSARIRQLAHRT